MENKKMWIRALSLIGFILVCVNCMFAFGSAASSSFIQVFFIVVMFALVILAWFISGDIKESLSVIASVLLYFITLIVRGFMFLLDQLIDFFRNLRLDNLRDRLDDATVQSARDKISKKIADLSDRISKDTFGEIMDVLVIIIAIAIIVFAVMAIINILKKKDFSNFFIGKWTLKLISSVEAKEAKEKPSKKAKVKEVQEVEVNGEEKQEEKESE